MTLIRNSSTLCTRIKDIVPTIPNHTRSNVLLLHNLSARNYTTLIPHSNHRKEPHTLRGYLACEKGAQNLVKNVGAKSNPTFCHGKHEFHRHRRSMDNFSTVLALLDFISTVTTFRMMLLGMKYCCLWWALLKETEAYCHPKEHMDFGWPKAIDGDCSGKI